MIEKRADLKKFFEAKRLFDMGMGVYEVAEAVNVGRDAARRWQNMGLETFIPSVAALSFLKDIENQAYRMVELHETYRKDIELVESFL